MVKPLCLALAIGAYSCAALGQLQPLLVSGQEGVFVDIDRNGEYDPSVDGVMRYQIDLNANVVVCQGSENIGGGVQIFSLEVFPANGGLQNLVLTEIAQYPQTGTPTLVNTRDPSEFVTIFEDNVDVNYGGKSAWQTALSKLMGGVQ